MTRRSKSTDFLKDCIADAMLQLMEAKPLEKLTAQEITDLAGVGRATFFRHFHSKGEILTYKLVRLWSKWAVDHDIAYSNLSLRNVEDLLNFNLKNRHILEKIYEAGMQAYIYEAFYQVMAPKLEDNSALRYSNRFYSYGAFGILDEWVKSDFKESPKEMADIVINQIVGQNITIT